MFSVGVVMCLRVCRICLARGGDCKLFGMKTNDLLSAYEWLSGSETTISKDALICSHCATLLKKCVNLRDMCRFSHILLQKCTPLTDSESLDSARKNSKYIPTLGPALKQRQLYLQIEENLFESIKKEPIAVCTNYHIVKLQIPTKDEHKNQCNDIEPILEVNVKKYDNGACLEENDVTTDNDMMYNNYASSDNVQAEFDQEIKIKEEIISENIFNSETSILNDENVSVATYKCTKCGYNARKHLKLDSHICKSHTRRKSFKCHLCTLSHKSYYKLKLHLRTKHTENLLKTPENLFVTHENGDAKLKARICVLKSPKIKTEKLQNNVKQYKCAICLATFTYKHSLKVHMTTHNAERPFKCTMCTSSYTQKGNLTVHMRTHTGERPFKCLMCASSFYEKGHLKRHLKTHTGFKSFVCKECPASFYESHDLKNHIRIHTGEKPYLCSICAASFSRTGELKIHMVTHTTDKPFKCAKCNTFFKRKNSMTKHITKYSH